MSGNKGFDLWELLIVVRQILAYAALFCVAPYGLAYFLAGRAVANFVGSLSVIFTIGVMLVMLVRALFKLAASMRAEAERGRG